MANNITERTFPNEDTVRIITRKSTDTSGVHVPHVTLDTLLSGEDQTNNVMVVENGQFDYERVEASQTDQSLGATGASGDFLHAIIPETTTQTIIIKDNTTTVFTMPAGQPIGVPVVFDMVSTSGAWKITTSGAGTACLAVGRFT